MRLARCFISVLLLFGLVSRVQPRIAWALGEQTGSISGRITEANTHLVIPGLLVTARAERTGGILGSAQTDEDGRYVLVALPPDRYTIELTHQDAEPYVQKFRLGPGEHANLDIAWKITALAEEKKVIERQTPTRPDSTETGGTLIARSLASLATLRTYQDASLLVPGTRDPTFGGNPNVKGGLSYGNRYLVDGIEVTDPVTTTSVANLNFDSISAIEVITGGMEAQYNTLGGIVNVVTQSGAAKWHVDASMYVSPSALWATNTYGSGLLTGPRPLSRVPVSASQNYTGILNAGGPLVKNKLWVHASLQYGYASLAVSPGLPLDVPHPAQETHEVLARIKLTYKPSEKHLLNLSVFTSPMSISNSVQDNYLLGVAENHHDQGGVFATLHWDAIFSPRVHLNVQASFQYSYLSDGPQGILGSVDTSGYDQLGRFSPANNSYAPSRQRHENYDDGTVWYQGSLLRLDHRYAIGLDPSLAIRGKFLGQHELKFGVQSRLLSQDRRVGQPGGSIYYDRSGGPGEAGLCDPTSTSGRGCNQRIDTEAIQVESTGMAVGAFVQDRWRPVSRLLILAGVRVDGGYSRNISGELVTGQWGGGPRIGFTLDLTGDERTILAGFYGRANETFSLLPAANATATAVLRDYRYDATSHQFVFNRQIGGSGGYLLDPSAQPPQSDEVTVSLRRRLAESVTAMVDYTYKHISYLWDEVEQNRIWDPSGTRVVGYRNGMNQDINLFTTRSDNQRTYQGVDLIMSVAMDQHLELFAAYTLSWLYGNTADAFGQIYQSPQLSQNHNPRLAPLISGYLPEDIRHQLRIRAAYTTHGVTLGATLQYTTGTPLTPLSFNPADGAYSLIRSPVGTSGGERNDPERFNELRNPDLVIVNARLSWDLHPLIHQHLVLIADCFNLLNSSTPVQLQARSDNSFGSVLARLTPMHAQFALRYLY